MVNIFPLKIPGRWREGYALDCHTLSSEFVGYYDSGKPKFINTYSEIGKLLNELKYNHNFLSRKSIIDIILKIAETVKEFIIEKWKLNFDIMIPVPPSKERALQPVMILTETLNNEFAIPVCDSALKRIKDISELKNEQLPVRRQELLQNSHSIDINLVKGKNILLFDDIFCSGATMNNITTLLYDSGMAADVFTLAITRTRSNA